MRRKLTKKNIVKPDLTYRSVKVEKFINYLMEEGKKNAARKIVYSAFEDLKNRGEKIDPLELFETALKNVSPSIEVRSRRIGGANYQVPREVRPERRQFLGMKWIIGAARSKKGVPMHKKLADELLSASKNEGTAVKKREDTHKMAESNKAFAHFAW